MLDLYAATREQLHDFAEEIKSRRTPKVISAKLKAVVTKHEKSKPVGEKICSKCKVLQPLTEYKDVFWPTPNLKSKIARHENAHCNSCVKKIRIEHTKRWAAAGLPNAIRNLKLLTQYI